MAENAPIKLTLADCPRCGTDHMDLDFLQLTNVRGDFPNFWATCPTTGQPILLTKA